MGVENNIPEGWVESTLNELAFINPRESIRKGELAKNVPMDCIDSFTRKISRFGIKEFKGGTKFKNKDTLLARITPCLENGKTALVDILDKDEIGFGSTEYIVIRENNDRSHYKFLYYLSISPKFRRNAIKAMTGTSGRQRVQTDVLINKVFRFPPLPEQKAIAKVLTAFDDKIELLQAQNKTLETMAQTIFKEWFGKYQIGDELPEGWRVGKLGDFKAKITDFVANGSFASLKENVTLFNHTEHALFIRNTDLKSDFKEKIYVDKKAYEFLSKTKLFGGEIIISNVGDVGSVHLCPHLKIPMTLGNNIIMLKSEYNYFFYTLFKSRIGQHLISTITGGSAQPKFNKTDFRNMGLIIPPNNLLNNFELASSKFFQKILKNKEHILSLTKTRDTLLPKLMSGQVRVNNIKQNTDA
jgi:type I restriction enzyme, S subunit